MILCRQKLATLVGSDAQLNDLVIYASPFTRTVETARFAAEAMGLPAERVQIADALRERFFGNYDLTPDTNYPIVWERDTHDAAAPVPGRLLCTAYSS